MSAENDPSSTQPSKDLPEYYSRLSDFSPAARLDILSKAEGDLGFIVGSMDKLFADIKTVDPEKVNDAIDDIHKITEAFSRMYFSLSYVAGTLTDSPIPAKSTYDGSKLRFDTTSSTVFQTIKRLKRVADSMKELSTLQKGWLQPYHEGIAKVEAHETHTQRHLHQPDAPVDDGAGTDHVENHGMVDLDSNGEAPSTQAS